MSKIYDNPYILEYYKKQAEKPRKIIYNLPTILEITDDDGNVHTYSIIDLLDGLTEMIKAKREKDE